MKKLLMIFLACGVSCALHAQQPMTKADSLELYKAGILPKVEPVYFTVIDIRRKKVKQITIKGFIREGKPLDASKNPLPEYYEVIGAVLRKEGEKRR